MFNELKIYILKKNKQHFNVHVKKKRSNPLQSNYDMDL